MIGAAILAAGEASRFGAPKQQLMLADVLRAVRASSVEEIVVVAGAYPLETDARVVECPDWTRGMGASLRCGLAALDSGVEAAVVCLADGPELNAAAIDRVIYAWHASAGDVLAASYGGERSHPVLLGRTAWPTVPDEGARSLVPVLVECDDLGAPGDVDYPEDLPERLRPGSL